jgi:hypothetical protein
MADSASNQTNPTSTHTTSITASQTYSNQGPPPLAEQPPAVQELGQDWGTRLAGWFPVVQMMEVQVIVEEKSFKMSLEKLVKIF